MKRILFLLALILSIAGATSVYSAEVQPVTVLVDGVQGQFDAAPIVENGYTLVPMRGFFEALGAEVTWLPEERSVMAVGGDLNSFVMLTLTIDSDVMRKEGKEIKLGTPARLINGKTFVPLRAVAEGFGADVEWNAADRVISIATGKQKGVPETIPKGTWLYDWLQGYESEKVEFSEDGAFVTFTGSDPRYVLFEWFYDLDPGLNMEIKYIALDMSEAKASDYSAFIELLKEFCEKNSLVLLEDTREGLVEKELIEKTLAAEPSIYYYSFTEGILISFSDIYLSEEKLVTRISKWRGSLGGLHGTYTLEKLDDLWIITEIGQHISN